MEASKKRLPIGIEDFEEITTDREWLKWKEMYVEQKRRKNS